MPTSGHSPRSGLWRGDLAAHDPSFTRSLDAPVLRERGAPPCELRTWGVFLGRPLDAGPYRYLWLDALTQKVREEGRIAQVSVVVATAVNSDGRREVLGIDVGTSEDGAFWLSFRVSRSRRGGDVMT